MHRLPRLSRPGPRLLRLLPALLLALATLAPTLVAPPAQARIPHRAAPDEQPRLSGVFAATPDTLAPGETATLAIQLRNDGADASNVAVGIVTARWLRYVAGSATPGAGFDSDRTVVWANVSLAGNSQKTFAIQVRAEAVPSATQATSVATVVQGTGARAGAVLVYSTTIVVRPAGSPPPSFVPNLRASALLPGRAVVRSGDTVSYTLLLVNTGSASAVVSASLVLTRPLSYVPDSATAGGAYDAASRTLHWRGVEVPSGEARRLRFAALAGSVDQRTPVVVSAAISDGTNRFERRAPLLVVPGRDDGNGGRPVVTGFAAGASDVTSEPTVTLSISATDDVSVTRMYVREWQLTARPFPRWEPVRSSGWVPFASSFPWTLGSANGVHIVGVWVEDAAGNRSALTDESIDVVNLVRPNATVARGGAVPYLVRYDAGVDVQLTLETLSGDADLYVWHPRSFRLADEISANEGAAADSVQFTTPVAGHYLIVVYGHESSSYNLSIAPGGGAQPAATTPGASGATPSAGLPASKQPGLTSLLEVAGTSPLGSDTAAEPSAGTTVYLPLVVK